MLITLKKAALSGQQLNDSFVKGLINYKEDDIDKTLDSLNIDWSNEECINEFESLTFNKGRNFQQIENDFNKQKDSGTQEAHKFFPEKIREIFNDHIKEIEALVKQWYLPDFKITTNEEELDNDNDYYEDSHGNSNDDIDDSYGGKGFGDNKKSSNFSHNFSGNQGFNTSSNIKFNQYYSVTIAKSVDNKGNSKIRNFDCKKLEYDECIRIDNIVN